MAILILCVCLGLAVLALRLATINIQTNVSGIVSGTGTLVVSDETAVIANPTVAAAQAGTLTTRTDNNTGEITMSSGDHTITTGQRVDLYWDGGTRYGVTVGTVTGTAVPIDLGGGDNLPVTTTAIKVGVPEQTAFAVVGDDLAATVFSGTRKGYFVFADGEDNDIAAVLLSQGEIKCWPGTLSANPLAGLTTASLWISHAETAGSLTTQKATAIGH